MNTLSNRDQNAHEQGLTLIELLVTLAIASMLALVVSEAFIFGSWNFLQDQATDNIVNSDRYALQVVSSYLSNAGYGFSDIGCQNLAVSAITVSPSGTPTSSTPPPVSLTLIRSRSDYAGIPVGQMVQDPQPAGASFNISANTSGNQATCSSMIQGGNTLIAAFPQNQCALITTISAPVLNGQGSCTVPYSTGKTGGGTLSTLLPNLTSADMENASVYVMGKPALTTTTFSVTAGTAAQQGTLQISTNGGQPSLFANHIDDMQILFGYNPSGGKTVTLYGYYAPQYAQDIRTASIALVASSRIKIASIVAPTQIPLFPAIPADESITGLALPALYYRPPAGATHQPINVMRATVPVMNQIW